MVWKNLLGESSRADDLKEEINGGGGPLFGTKTYNIHLYIVHIYKIMYIGVPQYTILFVSLYSYDSSSNKVTLNLHKAEAEVQAFETI